MKKNENKISGLLYGQAIGDALGLSTEFLLKKDVNLIYKDNITYDNIYQDEHRKIWKKGEWTDDTDMCLILFNHLLNCKNYEVNEKELAKEFKNWYLNGLKIDVNINKRACGIGRNIGRVLNDKEFLNNPKLSSLIISLNCPSNGAIMRSSVLALFPNCIENTINSCSITHYSEDCIVSCLFIVLLLKNLLEEDVNDIDKTINGIILDIEELKYDTEELKKYVNINSLEELKLNEHIGYTYKPLGCAVYSLKNHNNSFYNILQLVIREGGDADTNGCVVGAVLGCYLGYNNIDDFLIKGLINGDYLKNILLSYNKMSSNKDKKPDLGWNCNYKITIPYKEVEKHIKYIEKNNMTKIVYDYTVSSSDLRKKSESMKKLNDLIMDAPSLEKQYTVYHMASPDSQISIIKDDHVVTTGAENLEEGDIYTENINYKDTSIISTTYNKSYPLTAFSRDLAPIRKDYMAALKDNINMMSFFHIKKYSKKNKTLSSVYNNISDSIKDDMNDIIDLYDEEFTVEDLFEYYKTENARDDIRRDIKEIKNLLIDIYYTDICCCCIFKIKIKNKKGLLIEGVSQYPDQYELLLPNYTEFKVTKVYRQTYGVVINPMNYYNSTEKFIIGDKEYDRYNKLPDDMEYTIKNITVYEVETI